jgi:uncharacterized protein involved in tolerance to divalent cations
MTAIDAEDGAQQLAQSAVEARLAACVQVIGPIRSTYWWKGAIESTQEWLCLMKTPITYGSRDYLGWIEAEATGTSGQSL